MAERMRLSVDTKLSLVTLLSLTTVFVIWSLWLRTADIFPFPETNVFSGYAENIKNGLVPYKDFVVEFPQGCIIIYLLPGLFSDSLESYFYVFAGLTILLATAIIYFTLGCINENKAKIFVTASFILLIIIYTDFFIKFDSFAVIFALLALIAFSKKKYALAYGLATFAAMVKIYPALIVGMFFLINLFDKNAERKIKPILTGMVSSAFVFAVLVLPYMVCGADLQDIFVWISFHGDRGYHLESTIGIIVEFLGDIGIGSYTIVEKYNTYDVSSPITDALVDYSMMITLGCLAIVIGVIAIHLLRKGLGTTDAEIFRNLVIYSFTLILMFMLSNKVFSTVYILWLIPMYFWLGTTKSIQRTKAMCIITVAIFAISTIRPNDLPLLFHSLFILRDALFVILEINLLSELLGSEKLGSIYKCGNLCKPTKKI